VPAEPGRAERPAVARGAAVREARAERGFDLDVADPVADARADALRVRELALEELPPALDRAERVALDQEDRRIRGEDVPAPGPDLLRQGLLDPGASR